MYITTDLNAPTWRALNHASRLEPEQLDRLADFELQAGHHAEAERLAALAAEMREAQR